MDARLSPADGMIDAGSNQVIDGFARDITARKRAEQALEESEQRHRSYLTNTPYGIFAVDAEGRFLQVNPSACRISGYADHELLTMRLADLHFAEDWPVVQPYFQRVLCGDLLQKDLPFRRKDGERRWFGFTAVKITDNRFLAFCNDITEQKQAKEALLASETLFRNVFEHHAAIKLLIDPDSGEIIDANEAASAYYGWPRDQLRRMRMADINTLSPEALQDEMEQAKLAQRNHFEFRHRLANGSVRDVEVYSSRIHANNRTVLHSIIHDITERKRAEAENKHLQAQLVQAQKLEAIGTLAGGIDHDFNNILGAVIGYADMARDSVAEGSVVARDLNQILKAGHRAKDLVKQILAFSRQADTEPTVFYPALITKEAVKLLRPSLPATIAIKTHIEPKAGPVRIDPTLFHQVVMNLCTNAFHAMEATGGTLDISLTTIRIDEGRQEHGLRIQPGEYLRLAITDTGNGIAPEIQERIFDPFFTTKETGKGTGMGLAIVHGIITGSGGFITLVSTPDKGSVFYIHLPVVAETSAIVNETAETVPAGSEHILFIDDEDLLVEMTSEILERLGYRVTVRTSSLEALTTFQNQPDRFDLVITDQTMPGMTGTDLARRMLQIRPDLPIILCTGYSTLIFEEQAKAIGIRAFLLKPLARKDLAHLIRKVLTKP
jgi:PAS domain S-box-containing protein